ncbi:ATP-binding cassette domain-containing protein [Patescibacteria group bacterium]|nr:ATP-binding cassette domain-containing protein [Patescibacteria group bacterium]
MIKLDSVSKKFPNGTYGLKNIDLGVEKGEFVFLVGPTGSGKTTVFKLLIRETLASEGTVVVNNWNLTKLPRDKIPHFRKSVGMIFQDLKLLFDRTVLENIALPLEISGINQKEARRKVEDALEKVNLLTHREKFPIQLSGGELQRVAIARALVLSPDIILADEATGNLDVATSWEITNLLLDINKQGTTVLMATHNMDIVKNIGKRVVELDKGSLTNDTKEKIKKQDLQSEEEKKTVDSRDSLKNKTELEKAEEPSKKKEEKKK